VEFLAEYAPYDLYSLENMGRAIDLFPNFSGMIKLEQEPRKYWAAKATQFGFQAVLFADVRTVEDAKECVQAIRAETPSTGGLHGVAMTREVGVVLEGASPAFVQSLEDAVVALMIEKKPAVDNIEAILSVPGIDMVQFGPSDFSLSAGLAGQRENPAIREAQEFVIATALKKGIAPRVEIREPAQAEPWMKLGVKHFCMGWDVSVWFQYCKTQGSALRELLYSSGSGGAGTSDGRTQPY
jgi:4-hydroxy-2-oxoheptanedioate aldolase